MCLAAKNAVYFWRASPERASGTRSSRGSGGASRTSSALISLYARPPFEGDRGGGARIPIAASYFLRTYIRSRCNGRSEAVPWLGLEHYPQTAYCRGLQGRAKCMRGV